MTDQGDDFIRGAVEALLFISERPVAVEQLAETLPELTPGAIRKIIQDLKTEYEQKDRGMLIMEIAGGFQMLSSPHYSETIRTFFKTRVKERLSKPALETLAIVAYKQPVSRADVELIRGVNSDGVVLHLLNRGLVKVVGRKEVPGRPFLYGTTKQFLEYFGLKSLSDLPKLEDFATMFSSAVNGEVKPTAEGSPAVGEGQATASSSSGGSPDAQAASSDTVVNGGSGSMRPDSSAEQTINGEIDNVATDEQALADAEGKEIISVPSGASLIEERVIDDAEAGQAAGASDVSQNKDG